MLEYDNMKDEYKTFKCCVKAYKLIEKKENDKVKEMFAGNTMCFWRTLF